ncbi:MAG: hypothetical protein GXO89_14495 [Chlorobi bacterium]|nr:hypothetical protein [Chlorobiota bacterium]
MKIKFKWIGGATFIFSIDGELKIAVDPVLCPKGTDPGFYWFKSERIEEPVYSESDFEDIDLWLLTHDHEDHLDAEGISKISTDARIVANGNAASLLEKKGVPRQNVLAWGETKKFGIRSYKVEVEAIPAIHGINPISAFMAGNVNGYFVEISKGNEKFSIYITGDTVYKKRVVKALDKHKIDLMVPNMGAAKKGSWIMTLTLDSGMLEKMIFKLKPIKVIPVHYGTFSHYVEPKESIVEINDNRIEFVEVGGSVGFSYY